MEETKWLNWNFKEVEHFSGACYGILKNGDVELYTPYETAYPVITADEIQELAKILKEEK